MIQFLLQNCFCFLVSVFICSEGFTNSWIHACLGVPVGHPPYQNTSEGRHFLSWLVDSPTSPQSPCDRACSPERAEHSEIEVVGAHQASWTCCGEDAVAATVLAATSACQSLGATAPLQSLECSFLWLGVWVAHPFCCSLHVGRVEGSEQATLPGLWLWKTGTMWVEYKEEWGHQE